MKYCICFYKLNSSWLHVLILLINTMQKTKNGTLKPTDRPNVVSTCGQSGEGIEPLSSFYCSLCCNWVGFRFLSSCALAGTGCKCIPIGRQKAIQKLYKFKAFHPIFRDSLYFLSGPPHMKLLERHTWKKGVINPSLLYTTLKRIGLQLGLYNHYLTI